MLVEFNKDRNGRMIYTPLKPTNKPKISFGVKIRTQQDSDNKEQIINEITEVEYTKSMRSKKDIHNPEIKINVDFEVINKMVHIKCSKQCHLYKLLLTEQELIELINDEIKLYKKQSNNLVEIIDQASLSKQQINEQNDWEKQADEIRSELNATLPDSYPLPRIDDKIARLAKNNYLSKIDLANGYY